MAVVFISHMENGVPKQDGLCIKCAKELGIKPVNDIISNMGLSDEDVDRMSSEVENFMESMNLDEAEAADEEPADAQTNEGDGAELPGESRAPAIDFQKLFRGAT